MTTILPPTDLALIRAISRTAAVLLVCLRIDQLYPGRAIHVHEIADVLEQDPRTITRQLRSLSAAGMVLEQRENCYVCTPLGRNTLFPAGRQPSLLSIEETEKTSAEPFPRAQNVPHDHDHDLIDDESYSLIDNDSSSINEHTKCARFLAATEIIFGSPVSDSGIADRNPTYALAWIAKAYNDRHSLNNPQGLVYARLLKNERPPNWLLKDPARGLPDKYLIAIGLMEPASSDPEPVTPFEQPDPIPDDICEAWEAIRKHVETHYEKGPFRAGVTSVWRLYRFEGDTLEIDVILKKFSNDDSMRTEAETLLRQFGQDIHVRLITRGE